MVVVIAAVALRNDGVAKSLCYLGGYASMKLCWCHSASAANECAVFCRDLAVLWCYILFCNGLVCPCACDADTSNIWVTTIALIW
jgi:hypothetical protein